MPWVKLDDLFPVNKKVMLAGRDARALYITALCHSANQLTDGFIDAGLIQLLGAISQIDDPQASAQKLVEVTLWERAEDGYLIHDYHQYNPTRNEVMETREARAEAGFVGGVNSGEAKRKAKRKQNESKKDGETESKPNPVPVPVPIPVPDPENTGGKQRPKDLLFDAIREACCVDPETAGASIGKVKKSLSKADPPYTPDEVKAFRIWWDSDEWRRKKGPPSLWKLQEQIGIIRSEKANAATNNRPSVEYSQADRAAAAEVTRRNRERLAAAAVPAV